MVKRIAEAWKGLAEPNVEMEAQLYYFSALFTFLPLAHYICSFPPPKIGFWNDTLVKRTSAKLIL